MRAAHCAGASHPAEMTARNQAPQPAVSGDTERGSLDLSLGALPCEPTRRGPALSPRVLDRLCQDPAVGGRMRSEHAPTTSLGHGRREAGAEAPPSSPGEPAWYCPLTWTFTVLSPGLVSSLQLCDEFWFGKGDSCSQGKKPR